MSEFLDKLKKGGAKIETPFLIRQVESHLIFGPLSRHFGFGYIALVGAMIALIAGFFATNVGLAEYVGTLLDKLFFLIVPLLLLAWTLRQQAIIGWIAVKFGVGIAALITATVGSAISFQRGQSDAWVLLILGLIWIPWVEFFPKITPHQRYVTLARIVLTLPCVYFGIKSGNWRW